MHITMRTLQAATAALMLTCLWVCHSDHTELQVTVIRQLHLDSLSSASGVIYYNEGLYVGGDDTPWLYQLGEDLVIKDRIRISGTAGPGDGRVPKDIKADIESLELMKTGKGNYLLLLSSGSVPFRRDTAYVDNLDDDHPATPLNFRPLFEKIKKAAGILPPDEINIEGLAMDPQTVYLLHRGNVSGNIIAACDKRAFLTFMEFGADSLPEITIYDFNLPVEGALLSGFSGACMLPDNSGILFTASLEQTRDVFNDGEVLGSYVGIARLEEMGMGKYIAAPVMSEGRMIPRKLEGITIKPSTGNKMIVYAVCDNDDGSSELLEMEIFYRKK